MIVHHVHDPSSVSVLLGMGLHKTSRVLSDLPEACWWLASLLIQGWLVRTQLCYFIVAFKELMLYDLPRNRLKYLEFLQVGISLD